jgi:hypothetical protein
MRILLACSLLLAGLVACVSGPEPDPAQDSSRATQESRAVPVADDNATDVTPAETVPEDPQPDSAAQCRARGGVCVNFHLCFGSGGLNNGVACPGAGNVCCVQ